MLPAYLVQAEPTGGAPVRKTSRSSSSLIRYSLRHRSLLCSCCLQRLAAGTSALPRASAFSWSVLCLLVMILTAALGCLLSEALLHRRAGAPWTGLSASVQALWRARWQAVGFSTA